MAGRAKRGNGNAMPKSNISFNRERAIALNNLLIGAYEGRTGVFGYPGFTVAPECDAVEGIDDPLDAARLLFYSISTDQRNKSERLYPLFRAAYDKDPRNLDPAHLYKLSFREFREHFHKHFRVNVRQVVEGAYWATYVFHNEHRDDPRRIFEGVSDVHEALKIVGVNEETKLLGKQMGKLLLKNYIEKRLVEFENADEHPPKVDTWNTRMSIATGIAQFAEPGWYHSSAIVDVLDAGWEEVCRARLVQGMRVNNLAWALGSNVCARQDRRACSGAKCPLYETICDRLPSAYDSGGQIQVGVDVRKDHGDFIFHDIIEAMEHQRIERRRRYAPAQPLDPKDQHTLF